MNLFFDHICGQQADTDFIHCLVSATFDKEEYDWAFENGWCPSNIWYNQETNFKKENKIIWYQSRQSRINLNSYQISKSEKKLRRRCGDVKIQITQQPDFESLYRIYEKYVDQKNFQDRMNKEDWQTWADGWFYCCLNISETMLITGHARLLDYGKMHPWRWLIAWWKPAAMGRCPVGFNNWEPIGMWGKGCNKSNDFISQS